MKPGYVFPLIFALVIAMGLGVAQDNGESFFAPADLIYRPDLLCGIVHQPGVPALEAGRTEVEMSDVNGDGASPTWRPPTSWARFIWAMA